MAVSFFGLGAMEVLILMFLGGLNPGLLPSSLPPLPEDKALVSAAPEECLLYASWYGAAEPKSTSKNNVERLLAEPEVRQFAATIWKEFGAAIRRDAFHMGKDDAEMVAENVLPLIEIGLTRPGSLFLSKLAVKPGDFGPGSVDAHGGFILNAGPKVETLQRILARFEEMAPERLRDEIKTVEVNGVKFKKLPLSPTAPVVLYGFRAEYFVVALGEGSAEKIVAGLKDARGPPKWLKQIHERLPVERPAAVSYFNVKGSLTAGKAIAEAVGGETPVAALLPRILEVTGLDGLESVSSVSGLGETDHVAKTLVATTGKPRGVLNLLSDKPLTDADLAAAPRDASWLFAARFDAAKAYTQIVDMVAQFNPRVKDQIDEELEKMQEQVGFHLVNDLLEPLGDTHVLYSSPGEGGMFFGVTAVINIRNRDKLAKVNEVLLKALRREADDPDSGQPGVEMLKFAGQTVHVMDVGRGLPLAPSWCLTDKQLVIGLYPQSVKAYLARKSGEGSLADTPEVAALLKQKPITLMYQDTRELIRTVYPYLQMFAPMAIHEMRRSGMKVDSSLLPSGGSIYKHLQPTVSVLVRRDDGIYSETRQSLPGAGGVTTLAPVGAALLLPAVQKTREAASRAQSMNNLKQIALAMHNYHDTYRGFPAPANYDDDSKPLLSWRVHILPFIEQQPLYAKFKLDEPWDSKHNKELIKDMPLIYKVPGGLKVDDGKTCYLLPTGDSTAFPKGSAGSARGLGIATITDGTSNTIMAVEAAPDKAVIWTKPDDWEFDPDKPKQGLVGHRSNGFLAAFCDGSVRFINQNVKDDVPKAVFTRAGGEVVELP
jgi:hypothetical protein